MNKVVLIGRLTRDPEVRYSATERQMAIARYTLAVDRRGDKKDKDQTADFIPCVAFDRAGEFAEKYLRQGMKMAITGHIQTGSYSNKDGKKVFTVEVIVEDQEFAESKATAQGGTATAPDPALEEASATSKKPAKKTAASKEQYMEIPDENPFDFGE